MGSGRRRWHLHPESFPASFPPGDQTWLWQTAPKKLHFLPGKNQLQKQILMQNKEDPFPPPPQLQPQNCGLLVSLERFFGGKMCSETFACLPLPALVFLTLEKKKSDLHESLTSLLWENPAFCCCCFALGWIPWTQCGEEQEAPGK